MEAVAQASPAALAHGRAAPLPLRGAPCGRPRPVHLPRLPPSPPPQQAPHLTELDLHCPFPDDDDYRGFFGSLAAATQLRNLALTHGLTDQGAFTSGNAAAQAALDRSLRPLTRLTSLNLSGVCEGSVPASVGAMAALKAREA